MKIRLGSAVVARTETGRATRSVLMPDGHHILVLDHDAYQRGLKAANGKLGQMVKQIKDKSGLAHGKRAAR